MRALALSCAAAWILAGCAIMPGHVEPQPTLARAQSASDMASYQVQRVAVVPFTGVDLDPARAQDLENGLALELAPRVSFEIVQLSATDLAEIPRADPYRRGWYAPRTLLEIAERFHVDAVLVGTVREHSPYAPQRIATQVELVSCETGMVAWSSSVELDARDHRVITAIEAWYALERDSHDAPGDEALAMLSPALFARFATREMARSYR
jgi:TolB-like protein